MTTTTVSNELNEVYTLENMNAYSLSILRSELTAEIAIHSRNVRKREWLRDQRNTVESEIKRRASLTH